MSYPRWILLALVSPAVFFTTALFAEQVEISTYYPSPYGNYKNLETTEDTSLATSSGNVGIGISGAAAPQKLTVNGNAQVNNTLSTAAGTLNLKGGASGIQLQSSAGATKVTMLDNGRVGIGVPGPGAPLSVNGIISSTATNAEINAFGNQAVATKEYVDAAAGGSPGSWICNVRYISVSYGTQAWARCLAGEQLIVGSCGGDCSTTSGSRCDGYPASVGGVSGWACTALGGGGGATAYAFCCS